jgi:PAS domain S-box-containing protein
VDVSDCDKSKEQLIEELASLHREVAELQIRKTAFDSLHELLITLVTTGKTATGTLMLKAVLQQILKISNRLTNAEESSLFLLDSDGIVTESILARGAIVRDLKQKLIGSVLDKGFAGWISRHRQVGLIADTMHDERWLTLPSQPYTVRSALGVPLLRGNKLLSILTLMHSQPRHFSPKEAHLMQMTTEQMALIIESALLYVERQPSQPESYQSLPQVNQELDKPAYRQLEQSEEQPSPIERLSSLGIYIMVGEGRFMYTNPGVAAIFGYTFFEFMTVESIFELVAANDHDFVGDRINQCFQSPNKSLSCTFKGRRKDGSIIDVQVYGTKTKFSGKPVIIGVLSLT